MRQHPERLVFLDETGTNTRMTRTHGRSLKGHRLAGQAPFRYGGNQTLIAGLSQDGLVAPWVLSGAMDRDAFDTYVEQVLAPELEPGTVLILDNLAVHKSEKAAQILRDHGCWLLHLPPYSPDLNPIEMFFAKLKAYLRKIGARTLDQLLQAIGSICDMVTPDECWNYFIKAGYAA